MDAADALRTDLLQLIQTEHAAVERPSAREFARRTGVSRGAITHALAGTRVPARSMMLRLAEVYGADVAEWGRLWDAFNAARRAARSARSGWLSSGRLGRREAAPSTDVRTNRTQCCAPPTNATSSCTATAGRFSPKIHPALCSVEECGRPYYCRGLCKGHYERQRLARATSGRS